MKQTPEEMYLYYRARGRSHEQMKVLARAIGRTDFREYVERMEALEKEEIFA